jgi:hypothetical protein
VMATSRDGQQDVDDWLDLNYEQRELQPADSPGAQWPLPAPWVGLNATLPARKYDLQAKHV